MSNQHIAINITAVGDRVTAISTTQKLAKVFGGDLYLQFPEGFSICVHPDSNVQDLISKMTLEIKVKELLKPKQ